jgi:ornithine carbamoyltransferase
MVGCAKMGMRFVAWAPREYFPSLDLRRQCLEIAEKTGAVLEFEEDPAKAVEGADIIYTDVWVSMGEDEKVWESRIRSLRPYQVNQKLMDMAGEECVFMHCLPAFHDLNTETGRDVHARFGLEAMEVTDDVFEGPRSIVFDEAENRMHTIKAVMSATLGGC